jgi:hypothetical protein
MSPNPDESTRLLDEELVPELGRMRHELGEHITLEDWIAYTGDIRLAIAYMRVVWPLFVYHEGGVYISRQFSEHEWAEWKSVLGNDTPELERHINHVPLLDLFANPEGQGSVTHTQLQIVGQQLTEMWQAKLSYEHPGKTFIVELAQGENLEDFAITFYSHKGSPQ